VDDIDVEVSENFDNNDEGNKNENDENE